MGFWEILTMGIGVIASVFGKKTLPYFQARGDEAKQAKRTGKAALATRLVGGVVEWFKLTGDVSEPTAKQIDVMVNRASAELVGNGFKVTKSLGIAQREVAQALKSG